tara:strand:- start:158 stop:724 length:567 start_codon:yes stop_codon:yes gene_type:complete
MSDTTLQHLPNVQPLDAIARERVGSTYSKRLREAGRLPAVIYGRDGDCISIHMDENETMKQLNRGFRVFRLSFEGSDCQDVKVQEFQFGHLGDNLLHIDFVRVDLNEKINSEVAVRVIGHIPGAKTIDQLMSSIEISSSLGVMPQSLEVRGDTAVDGVISASSVGLPEGVDLVTEGSAVVAQNAELAG